MCVEPLEPGRLDEICKYIGWDKWDVKYEDENRP